MEPEKREKESRDDDTPPLKKRKPYTRKKDHFTAAQNGDHSTASQESTPGLTQSHLAQQQQEQQLQSQSSTTLVIPRIRPPPLQPNDLRAVPHPPPFQLIDSIATSSEQYEDDDQDNTLPEFFSTEDHPHNKRGFRYIQCSANPSLSSVLYAVAEVPPFTARVSFEDRSSNVYISRDALTVTTNHGFRSARANVGIREGMWYYEVRILKANDPTDKSAADAHVRIGITRREASLEAPVGHDAYGYGLRDVSGEKVHISRPATFMNESFKSGDVIGFYICIPRDYTTTTSLDISRDRIPIRYKGQLFFETLDYVPTKSMDELILPKTLYSKKRKDNEKFVPTTIPGSFIRIFKNGKDMGLAFEDLIEFLPPHCQFQKNMSARDADDGQAGYYPTISVFRGGKAQFNFGPNFEFPIDQLSSTVKPLSFRYNEQIAEDVVFDLVDQVDFEIIDNLEDARIASMDVKNTAKNPAIGHNNRINADSLLEEHPSSVKIVEIAPVEKDLSEKQSQQQTPSEGEGHENV